MRIDLHLHSHVSDGQLSPTELVGAALAARLDVVSLTDHDTAAGVAEALLAARDRPIQVIPGIEISTRHDTGEFHVLGYWIDPSAPSILEHQEASVVRRADRMRSMVRRLQELGLSITFEDVEQAAGPAVRSIGRPHLARALLAAGQTRFYGEAFARYISDIGPAFVEQDFPSPAEAISTIHAAGGVAVWAHPPLDLLDQELPGFAAWGLDGVECFRSGQLPGDTLRLEAAARRHGLFPTGGSDWHGPHRAPLGDFFVDDRQVAELLARGQPGERSGD